MSKYKVLTLNNIALAGLERLPRDHYEVASEIGHPEAILVRSYDMHSMEIPNSVLAVARAGVGVNNIPVEHLSHLGIPVFNAPGANANAVKELVLAGIFIAARNICHAWKYVLEFDGDAAELESAVEAGKKRFVGFELPSRTLGVVGLGSIGVEVANAALGLNMRVLGFDPDMTVERAWQLSSGVEQAGNIDAVFRRSDIVTVHVPLNEATHGLIDQRRIALMKPGSILLNFARGRIVDTEAVVAALENGQLSAYVCDFPIPQLKDHPKVIALPHLGASTGEAEENCAIMVAENLRDFLENGNIRRSVNFPEAILPRPGGHRLVIANENVPNMVGQISTCLADAKLNIEDLLNKSRGELAFTLVDTDGPISSATIDRIRGIEGILSARALNGG